VARQLGRTTYLSKCGRVLAIEELYGSQLFNEIMRTKKMPDEWRRNTLIPIYKNKGDIQNCANYRGIKLMSHTMKLWERVIERRLRKETRVTDNQFGFMPGRSTMEAIYLLRCVMERYRTDRKDLHLVIIDLEKAYDRVPREFLWKALEKGLGSPILELLRICMRELRLVRGRRMGLPKIFP